MLNDKFVRLHPNFVGIKVIYAVWRGADDKKMKENVEEFKFLGTPRQSFPADWPHPASYKCDCDHHKADQ